MYVLVVVLNPRLTQKLLGQFKIFTKLVFLGQDRLEKWYYRTFLKINLAVANNYSY